MRTAFIQELLLQARTHPDIFLVVGDLGFSVVEPFAAEFPERFLNAGVAEQNMTGVAAGLASEGYRVFTYSIANFPTLRCLEQIRNDICYHKLPVTVVSVGGGLAYGSLGYSHHALQDLGIMRMLPNMAVMAPGDPGETRECLRWILAHPGPAYLRLGKAGEKDIHAVRTISHPICVRKGGGKYAIVSTGGALEIATEAAAQLAGKGIDASVYSCPCLAPLAAEDLKSLERFRTVITVEEHVEEGGLGMLMKSHLRVAPGVISFSVSKACAGEVGSHAALRKIAGIDATQLAEHIASMELRRRSFHGKKAGHHLAEQKQGHSE